jgi:ABC-type glycerol-3-phosphate transport system substrate-binding protein
VESLPVAYEDFRTKLFTSISGGVLPLMLARIDIVWTPELADMGALGQHR